MSPDPNEILAAELLKARGLRPERFSKSERRTSKTPDFRVFEGHDLVLFCEVKAIDRDRWLDRQLTDAPPMTIVGGARPDPTFNRLTQDIHEAVQQFDAINPELRYPNVLIFVNHEAQCDFQDLVAVTTGQFFADSGKRYPIYRWYSEGRIRDEKQRVHLYAWVTPGVRENLLVNQTHDAHFRTICRLFGIDPSVVLNVET
jgi:hypothetical protein